MKDLLRSAREEIISLRRQNEILSAKVEMIDLFACVLHTRPAMQSQGAAVDVAWQLQKEIDELTKAEMIDGAHKGYPGGGTDEGRLARNGGEGG